MTTTNEALIGNLTTILKILILTFAPAALLENIDANMLATIIVAIIMFIFSIIDAKYPNTFKIFDNSTSEEIDISDDGI